MSTLSVLEPEAEEKMEEHFWQQAKAVFENEEDYSQSSPGVNAGVEVEYFVVNHDLNPVDEAQRNELISQLSNRSNVEADDANELGASQIEIPSEPVMDLNSIDQLAQSVEVIENELVSLAEDQGMNVIRNGSISFIDLDDIQRTETVEKYQVVPDVYDRLRDPNVEGSFGVKEEVDPRRPGYPAATCATQLNVQAQDFEDAVEKANYTYMVSPFLAAISGNSRFIGGKDTGFTDTRIQLWERAFDRRDDEDRSEGKAPDIGRINSYFEDLDDYLGRVVEQPFILNGEECREKALDIGIGMFWKDARIKVDREAQNLLVESRIPSTQPTLEEDMAVHAFYLGRLGYAQETGEDLMDIEEVNRNRHNAIHHGLDAPLYDSQGNIGDASEVLEGELDKAVEGLSFLGIDTGGYLGHLYQRANAGQVPSDLAAEAFYESLEEGADRETALWNAVEATKNGDYQ